MHPCIEKAIDFTSAALVPGKLVIDDRRFDKVEGNTRYFNPVIAAIDITSYAMGGGLCLWAYQFDSPAGYLAAGTIAVLRGALGVRTNSDRRTFENHHKVSDEEIPVRLEESTFPSRMLPRR